MQSSATWGSSGLTSAIDRYMCILTIDVRSTMEYQIDPYELVYYGLADGLERLLIQEMILINALYTSFNFRGNYACKHAHATVATERGGGVRHGAWRPLATSTRPLPFHLWTHVHASTSHSTAAVTVQPMHTLRGVPVGGSICESHSTGNS